MFGAAGLQEHPGSIQAESDAALNGARRFG
jgi:hypothetical protein